MNELFVKTKKASKSLALLSDQQRNEILLTVADAIMKNQERILKAVYEQLVSLSAR